jgi:hypothetical protein
MSKQPISVTPTTTVLELSQRDADVVHQNVNGDYTVHFAEPINLKPGDSMNMRMASIDSQKATSSSIVIPSGEGGSGLPISLSFSYYDTNYELVTPDHPDASATPSPVDPTLQKNKFGVTPSQKYEPDYEFYSTFIEPTLSQLDSFKLNYQGTCPFHPVNHEADQGEVTQQIVVFICYPIFSWIDENGVQQTNTNALGIKDANPGSFSQVATNKKGFMSLGAQTTMDNFAYMGVNVFDRSKQPLADSFNWGKFTSETCIPYGEITTAVNKVVIDSTNGWYYGGNQANSKKIIFKNNSLKLIGVNSICIGEGALAGGISNGFTLFQTTANGKSFTAWSPPDNAESITPVDVTAGKKELLVQTAGTVIPPGRYDRETLAQLITEGFTEVGLTTEKQLSGDPVFGANTTLQRRIDSEAMNGSLQRRMPDITDASTSEFRIVCDSTNSYQYNNTVPVTIGAREFAIEYGQVGETYQITKMHQSVNSGLHSERQQEQIATFFTPAGGGQPFKYNEVLTATGIFIHDMNPRSFWQDQLGLYDKVIIPTITDPSGTQYVNRHDIADRFTSETAQIQAFSIENQRGTPAPTSTVYFNTTSLPTKSIIGDAPKTNEGTGTYYLIEITGLNTAQSNFIDNESNRGFISAIVSKQYDNNDSVTAFQDSAIPYVHRGVPVQIASARVRILDPTTKEVVTTLGEQNSIFLQINSGVENIPVQSQNQIQGEVPK